MVNKPRAFSTHLRASIKYRPHHDLARNAFSKGHPGMAPIFADDLERWGAAGAETIAAVIVEPVPGSNRVLGRS